MNQMSNIIPISSAVRPEPTAVTATGDVVTSSDCEAMLANALGYEFKLVVSDTQFKVSVRYPETLPTDQISAFLIVNDGGYPFLLSFVRRSFGVDIVHNSYVNPLLERDLEYIRFVDVCESAGDDSRAYQVPLRHSAE